MSKVPQAWHERLDPLDVVYCRFPDEGWPDPAPNPRPALVLNVNDESVPQRVEVAYGTSQRTRNKYAGEFELAPRDGAVFRRSGLTVETKFDLGRTVWLPYNDRWFTPPPAVRRAATPRLGTLDLAADHAIKRRFVAAAMAAGVLDEERPNSDNGKITE